MSPTAISLLTFVCLFGVGLLAMRFRAVLPEHHLSADTKDTVKVAMALVATMTALVIGLVIGSAKGTYDAEKTCVTTAAARIVVLDRMLAHYGPETSDVRAMLRRAVTLMEADLWPPSGVVSAGLDPSASSGDALYDAIQQLSPKDDRQRVLKAEALTAAVEVGETRWLLYAQSGSSISVALLVVVVSWLALLFCSFGLFAPANGTAVGALMVSALSLSGAMFLILELDYPFGGMIHIPSNAMQLALAHLGK